MRSKHSTRDCLLVTNGLKEQNVMVIMGAACPYLSANKGIRRRQGVFSIAYWPIFTLLIGNVDLEVVPRQIDTGTQRPLRSISNGGRKIRNCNYIQSMRTRVRLISRHSPLPRVRSRCSRRCLPFFSEQTHYGLRTTGQYSKGHRPQ